MSLSETVAVDIATDKVQKFRDLEPEEYKVDYTKHAAGRWKVVIETEDGEEIGVRLDDETGNLAEKDGHNKTSWNLVP